MGSDPPSSQTFHSGERRHRGLPLLLPQEVEDAEGLDKEHVGKDVTGRNRPSGPSDKDTTTCGEMRNTDSFYLDPMRCAHIGKML